MADKHAPRIVVVDDNPATRYSTARVLKAAGFAVMEAAAGYEAVEQARNGADAVVLDVHLPDISGFEVCRLLRSHAATARVPVIHLSATFVKDVDKVMGLEAGADGYLTHPVEPPVLIATVNAFLRARAAEDQREKLLISERAARAEAEKANRLKDDFLATLSHELRTPLNAIVGWSHLLRSGKVEPDELAEGLEAIERNAKAQTQLISDLLDVSRIASGKLHLDLRRIDPSAMIDSALDAVKPAAAAKNIGIFKTLCPSGNILLGDPGRLQQILWNLVNNSVKFTPRGGKILIGAVLVDSQLEITVTDNGEGIDPALLPHIFNRFQQGDASTTRQHGGLGLGLAIVKHLAELHGGSITASSAGLGHGSSLVLRLPVSTPGVSAEATGDPLDLARKPAEQRSIPSLGGLKIMVVDDDADGRTVVRRVLSDRGAVVADTGSVAECLSILREFTPDILISDIGMPDADGYELIRQVRATGLTAQNLPAIALTAFARTEDRRRALLAGYQAHLTKPVDPGELITLIHDMARGAHPSAPVKY